MLTWQPLVSVKKDGNSFDPYTATVTPCVSFKHKRQRYY